MAAHLEMMEPPPAWKWRKDGGLHDQAVACFAAAVAAAEPGRLVRAALSEAPAAGEFTHLIAVGKAARAMATAADARQRARGHDWRAALVISEPDGARSLTGLTVLPGDHPVPGDRSFRAAAALDEMAGAVGTGDHVLLLLSGGTSSLMGAPVPGLTPHSLQRIFRTLLASGLDIHAANRIRKRFLRWGAGRLAGALTGARVTALALSDVPGDDPASIGSGPVSPDPATAAELLAMSRSHDLDLPADAEVLLRQAETDPDLETPKPGNESFAAVHYRIIGSNLTAADAALAAARARGFHTIPAPALAGEASEAGEKFAMLARESLRSGMAIVAGGETTVTLGTETGRGGRNQEFALAAAEVLRGIPDITLLAAGTDGHDGNSDAAGGVVDGTTWERISDPASFLDRHDSSTALAQAGALLQTGPTGTNVMDLAIALRR
jgi:glycerate-2-kinase